jgi:hypothetical protein
MPLEQSQSQACPGCLVEGRYTCRSQGCASFNRDLASVASKFLEANPFDSKKMIHNSLINYQRFFYMLFIDILDICDDCV